MYDRDIIGPPRRKIAASPPPARPSISIDDRSRFKRSPEPAAAPASKPVVNPMNDMFVHKPQPEVAVKPAQQAEVPKPAEVRIEQPTHTQLPINRILGIELDYSLQTPSQPKIQFHKLNFNKLRGYVAAPAVVTVFAIAVLGLGLFFSPEAGMIKKSFGNGGASVSGGSVTGQAKKTPGQAVSEVEPTQTTIDSYQTAADQPRYLRIPIQGLKAPVMAHDKLEAPDNIYDTSWYSQSAKLGDKLTSKATVIVGYAHGQKGIGAYGALKKLLPHDLLQIEDGDGQQYNFQVVKMESYASDQFDPAKVMSPITSGKPGLNLVSAVYPSDDGTSQQVTVVYADPL